MFPSAFIFLNQKACNIINTSFAEELTVEQLIVHRLWSNTKSEKNVAPKEKL